MNIAALSLKFLLCYGALILFFVLLLAYPVRKPKAQQMSESAHFVQTSHLGEVRPGVLYDQEDVSA